MASWNSKLDAVMGAWEKQQKEIRKEREDAKKAADQTVEVLLKKRANTVLVEDVKGRTETIRLQPENSLSLFDCQDSLFFFPDKCARISIQQCNRCTFVISGTILTRVLELVRCDQVAVLVLRDLPTIQIDFCARIVAYFKKPEFMQYIYTTKSCGLFLAVGTERIENPSRVPIDVSDFDKKEDWRWHEVQYRTRIKDGKLRTSPVARDQQGFPLDSSPHRLEVGFNPSIVRTVPRMENDKTHPCSLAESNLDQDLFGLEDVHGNDVCVHHTTPGGNPNITTPQICEIFSDPKFEEEEEKEKEKEKEEEKEKQFEEP